MHPRLADAALLTLAPALWAQGKYVRWVTPKLPEPAGTRFGTTGEGPPLRLLVLGDSAAAGVGAPDLASSLLGRLIARLGPRHRLTFGLVARTGMNSTDALGELFTGDHARERWDVVLTSLGVNDATSLKRTARFRREQREIVARIRERFAPRRIVLSGLPPVHAFPALPQPLRAVIGARATRFDATLAALAGEEGCAYVSLRDRPELILDHIAADGFHPGPEGYLEWAALVDEAIGGWRPTG